LGDAIKDLREKDDRTQVDVAYDAQLSLRHYQYIESGRMNATLKTLHEICKVLDTDVYQLFALARRIHGKEKGVLR
jgi:DNA-binding XRE family transcriptional regulator